MAHPTRLTCCTCHLDPNSAPPFFWRRSKPSLRVCICCSRVLYSSSFVRRRRSVAAFSSRSLSWSFCRPVWLRSFSWKDVKWSFMAVSHMRCCFSFSPSSTDCCARSCTISVACDSMRSCGKGIKKFKGRERRGKERKGKVYVSK